MRDAPDRTCPSKNAAKEANEVRERAAWEPMKSWCEFFPPEARRYQTTLAAPTGPARSSSISSQGELSEAQKLGFDGLASLDRLKRDFPARSDPTDLSSRMRVLEDVGCILVENRPHMPGRTGPPRVD